MTETDFGMTKINLTLLPEFLKNSFLYNTLTECQDDEEDNNLVLLPNEAVYNFNFETNLCNSLEEFEKAVYVLNYWGCNELPQDFLDFAENISKSISKTEIIGILDKTIFKDKFQHLTDKCVCSDKYYLQKHIEEGYFDLTKFFLKKVGRECINDDSIFNKVIEYGFLDVLKYLHENGYFQPDWLSYDFAVLFEQIHVLEYFESVGVGANGSCLERAIRSKQLESVKYLHKNGSKLDTRHFYESLETGDSEIIEYLLNNGCPYSNLGFYTSDSATSMAVKENNLEVLKLLHKKGFPWDSTTVENAVKFSVEHSSNMDCLKYLIENNCPYDEKTLKNEFLPFNLQATKYFFEKGLSLDEELFNATLTKGDLEVLEFLLNNDCEHKHTINGVLCTTYVIERSDSGEVGFLQLLHKHNFPFDITTTNTAVQNVGLMFSMNCLRYLIQNGSPYDESTMKTAILSNDISTTNYLLNLHFPIPEPNFLENKTITKEVYSYLVKNVYSKNELSGIKIHKIDNPDDDYY